MEPSNIDHAEDGEIELRVENSGETEQQRRQEFSLPPAASGKDAWLFLMTCFFVEAIVWGK